MDNLEYPLSPFITPVAPGRPAPRWSMRCPEWMLSADGGLLSLVMIALFIFVIVAMSEPILFHAAPDQHIHFVGVGGFGMSAIARVLLHWGTRSAVGPAAPTR